MVDLIGEIGLIASLFMNRTKS